MLKENVSAVSARKSDESPGQTGRKLGANASKARSKRYESSEQTTRKPRANEPHHKSKEYLCTKPVICHLNRYCANSCSDLRHTCHSWSPG